MRGARIKFGCMNVHSIQIRKLKRLERKLNRSKNPAAVLSLQETWTNAKSRVILNRVTVRVSFRVRV